MTNTHRAYLVLPAVLALAVMALLGWQWRQQLRCERIDVRGAEQADAAALVALAGVDTSRALFEIDPLVVADRVRRHPWVAHAEVHRLPTGTLRIDVRERTPTLLVLDRQGRPARYLDAEGFQMPVVPGWAYNVPLLRGLTDPYHPVRPVRPESLRALLGVLPALDPSLDALLSEFEIRGDGEIWLHTTPLTDRTAIPVRLGRAGFGEKLARLHAYWHQAVLPQPGKTFAMIDLRFDSQIVTNEE